MVAFDQVTPLGELYVTWTGGDREMAPSPPDGSGTLAPTESEEEDYT
jgi:hypothetical protein